MRALVLLLLLLASTARGADLSLTVVGEPPCPTRDDVLAALGQLSPSVHLIGNRDGTLAVRVIDLGKSWMIETTSYKVIEDPLRRCDERARSAALVIALALDEQPPPPAPTPTPPTPPAPPPPQLPSPRLVPLIDRPQVLSLGHVEGKEEVTFGFAGTSCCTNGYGFTSVTDVDGGVGRRVMVGGFVAVPVVQDTSDITIVPRVTVGLSPHVALRFELGYDRQDTLSKPGQLGEFNGAFGALALLTRVRVHHRLLLTFGETGPRTEWPVQVGPITNSLLVVTSTSLFSFSSNAVVTVLNLSAPVALVWQPHDRFALRVSLGLSVNFVRVAGAWSQGMYFPFSVDLIGSPGRHVDVGASFGLPMPIGDPAATYQAALFVRIRI